MNGQSRTIYIRIGVVVITIFLFFSVRLFRHHHAEVMTYRAVPVTYGDIRTTILATGVVQPQNRLEMKPPIAGRAEYVLVDEGAHVTKGQLLLWMSSTERAALLDAAKARGAAEFKRWETFYKATPIYAPIDGTIIFRKVEPGQTFTTSDAVLVMSDRLTVQAQVDETDIAQIALQQSAEIILDAYPQEKIPARVAQIAYDAKTVNNVTTYVVDVLPESVPEFMRSGMTANVSFVVGAHEHVLVVPSDALKRREGKSFVLLDAPTQRDHPPEQSVETGATDGKQIEITSGLHEGDTILAPQFTAAVHKNGGTNPFSSFTKPRATPSPSH